MDPLIVNKNPAFRIYKIWDYKEQNILSNIFPVKSADPGPTKPGVHRSNQVQRVQDSQVSNEKTSTKKILFLTIPYLQLHHDKFLITIKGSTIKDIKTTIMQFYANFCCGWGNPLIYDLVTVLARAIGGATISKMSSFQYSLNFCQGYESSIFHFFQIQNNLHYPTVYTGLWNIGVLHLTPNW